jgi:hypothetical protein
LSTYERKTPIADERIPEGFEVFFHEVRGYDSPDRWYTAWKGRRQLRGPDKRLEFGRLEGAITACVVAKAIGPRPWWERLG